MQFYGDFCGFTFNGVHTSDLGILRVSGGDRYEDTLGPAFDDKTINIPGGMGSYYFNTVDTQRIFDLRLAFDNMHEIQFRRARQVFKSGVMGELIFDEVPYKVYTAKLQSPPQFQYICFDDESTGERVYKGEGTIHFICYYPYARSQYKWLMSYRDKNREEWAQSSGLLPMQGNYDAYDSPEILLYNPGDLPTDWVAYYDLNEIIPSDVDPENPVIGLHTILFENEQNEHLKLCFSDFARESDEDDFIGINSKTQLIEGYKGILGVEGFHRTGTLYNKYIDSGDFFQIPLGESRFCSYSSPDHSIAGNPDVKCAQVNYHYLYY